LPEEFFPRSGVPFENQSLGSGHCFGVPVHQGDAQVFAPYHGLHPNWKAVNSCPCATSGSHWRVWFACGSSRRSVVKTPV
jgi:hypothetical protein